MSFSGLLKQYLLFGIFLAFNCTVFAQMDGGELYIPRNIKRAYEKNTRRSDGKPGANYWQNHAIYNIEVEVDVENRMVIGEADIQYINESPDELKIIRIKLAHELWRKGGQRNYDLSPSDITDEGVDVQSLKVDGNSVKDPNSLKSNTFLDVKLEKPLASKGNLTIKIKWQYKAPVGTDAPRECVCDPTSWFVAYWYPQVAVYDDLHGWADAPYTGTQEMYNDFSDYDVKITVPNNTMAWATGELQNAKDILEPEFLQKFEAAKTATDVIKVFSPEDFSAKKKFFQKGKKNTFHYKATAVPDFAFAFSDHYLWDATSVEVDANTKRRALVAAVYDPKSQDYYTVCQVASDAIGLMSRYQPGYPYPFPCMTVFNGNDGMEFPMMCNDASTHPNSPISLTCHEISHTYFPFMMGINEQYYAWMDEGWASFFDVVLTDTLNPAAKPGIRNYAANAGNDNDVPPITPSRFLNSPAYRVAAYTRPQCAYFTLLDMLGYKKFHRCMTDYMDTWKGKHPMPFDFFNTWNVAAGQNMDWYWKPWFFDHGYPDLSINDVQPNGRQTVISIENKGTLPVAIHVEVEFEDGTKETIHQTAIAWKDGKKTITVAPKSQKKVVKATLGNRFIPDVNLVDNDWPEKN